MTGEPGGPAAWYRTRREMAATETASLEARSRKLSRLRVATFVLAAGPFLLLETSPRAWWPPLLAIGSAAALAFVALLAHHRRVRRHLNRAGLRVRLQEEGLARLERRWDALPLPDLGKVPAGHPWGEDLDVVGRASLAHLLGTVATAPGRAALRHALLDPLAPPPSDPLPWLRALEHGSDPSPGGRVRSSPTDERGLRERTEAVEELAGQPVFREELQLRGREGGAADEPEGLQRFLTWGAGPGWVRDRGWAVPLGRVLAVANPGLLTAWLAGWLALPFWVVGVLAALALHRRIGPAAANAFAAGEAAERSVARWGGMLEACRSLPGDAPLLIRLRSAAGGDAPAAPALRALERITEWAAVRRSALTHFPLVALFAWDVHHLERLERWRERHGRAVAGWVHTLGEIELLSALATLRFDHPDWAFAEETSAGRDGIQARALRHPLLPPEAAVANDVEVPPPGRLLLVTGSNMSGKSTLLRALGTNQLLSLMGGPVAAEELRSPAIVPWTSMRIQDSLSQGVSFFLAELRRIRDVVEAARRGPVLVLLDEILQGTNTAERRTAARIVLRHLIDAGALGAVSTHDLTLAAAEDLRPHLVQVHLREQVRDVDGRRTLSFDHRLRPGLATSKNALLLLEMVGLGAVEEEDEPRDEPV